MYVLFKLWKECVSKWLEPQFTFNPTSYNVDRHMLFTRDVAFLVLMPVPFIVELRKNLNLSPLLLNKYR